MKKILIIEDNDMMRLFLQNYLGKVYAVKTVSTPSQAMVYCEQNSLPDLVISDYQEKHSEESEILKALNMQLQWRNTPLFILTDEDKSVQRMNALSTGARDTMSKPFNPKELNLRVDCLLNQLPQTQVLRTVA